MEKQKKRSFLTLVRAFLLLFAGYWLVRTAVENALDKVLPTSVIVFSVLGIPTFCLGLYYAFVFIRGDKGNSSDMEDDVSRQLRMLKELYDSGILTEEEYFEKKSNLLDL